MARLIKGQIIIEILIAFGLASLLLPAILTGFISGRSGRVQSEQRSTAIALLKEAEEAVRVYREADWTIFAQNGTYYPAISGTTWELSTDSNNGEIDGFSREVVIEDAYRDGNNQLSESGTVDLSVKKVTLSVSWGAALTDSISTTYYLTRWKNLSFTQSDEVQPSAGGFADWCQPDLSDTDVNLDRQGHPTVLSAKETPGGEDGNRILAGTGANSSGPAFSNIKIIGNEPPGATNLGDYNGTPQAKVNGLDGETIMDKSYAYLAANNPVGVAILDVTASPYSQVGSFKPSNENFMDVRVVGNIGYAITGSTFYIFGINDNRTQTTLIGSLSLAGGVKMEVDPSGQYAYVATSDSGGELKIIDIHTNPGALTSADVVSVNTDSAGGKDVFIDEGGTRAYLVTAASTTQPEFFIINIEDKSNPSVITGGTYDTNGMNPEGVVVVSGNRAIVVGVGGNEYQVFIVDGDTVSSCPNHAEGNDFLNIDSGVFAISSLLQTDNHAYSYIATGDADAEIMIIEGGPGGGAGGGTGVFESETLPVPDPGHDVVFNSFTATADPDLSYKISIKQGVSGSCSAVTYDDGDFVDFVPGPLPVDTIGSGYVNPGQCLRYRVVNLGTSTKSFTISFNYSP